MGRGRQKAKQTKVARKLKYFSPDTDLDALQRELASSEHSHYDEYDYEDAEDKQDEEEDLCGGISRARRGLLDQPVQVTHSCVFR